MITIDSPVTAAVLFSLVVARTGGSDFSGDAVVSDQPTSGRRTLQDDPVFQPKKYQRNIEEDPECSRDALWGPFRLELMAAPEEQRIDLAYYKTLEWGLENATVVDEQAKICMMGLISLQSMSVMIVVIITILSI